MNETPVSVRFIEERDLDAVVECEARSHSYVDPDFGTTQVAPYAWERQDFIETAKQYRSPNRGTNDTRTLVAEVMAPAAGSATEEPWVCGAIAYELLPEGYEILLLTAHPDAPPGVRKSLLEKLTFKAEASEERKTIQAYVPDGDWVTLKFFMDLGWSHSFRYNPAGNDSWFCVQPAKRDTPAKVAAK